MVIFRKIKVVAAALLKKVGDVFDPSGSLP